MGRSSGRVQWRLTWTLLAAPPWPRVTEISWISRISGKWLAVDAQLLFEVAAGVDLGGGGDGGGFALDVGEQRGDAGDLALHLGLESSDDVVGLAQGHGFGDFEVLLDVEGAFVLPDADVVDGEVGAGGDGADAVEHAFAEGGGGHGVDDDVGSGEKALHGFGRGEGDLFGALEGEVSRAG